MMTIKNLKKLQINEIINARTKHINAGHHYLQCIVEQNVIVLEYCEIDRMIIDTITNPLPNLPNQKFTELQKKMELFEKQLLTGVLARCLYKNRCSNNSHILYCNHKFCHWAVVLQCSAAAFQPFEVQRPAHTHFLVIAESLPFSHDKKANEGMCKHLYLQFIPTAA